MPQNIIKFLILNQNTEADKHNQQKLKYCCSNWWTNLPAPLIFVPENN
jgi:hypothetical protein